MLNVEITPPNTLSVGDKVKWQDTEGLIVAAYKPRIPNGKAWVTIQCDNVPFLLNVPEDRLTVLVKGAVASFTVIAETVEAVVVTKKEETDEEDEVLCDSCHEPIKQKRAQHEYKGNVYHKAHLPKE